jgi:calcineurin-like phosphoesterase family protein
MTPRTIAIGDIHGCSRALETLLAAIGPRPEDAIVTLGDYVNRGPDSRGVIDRLIALEGQCTLVPILGNHDQMFLQILLDARAARASAPPEGSRAGAIPMNLSHWLQMGGAATLASYGIPPRRAGAVELARVPDEHVAFLERCRNYHETETHIFLHAQYEPDMPMEGQPSHILRWESLRNGTPSPHVSGKRAIVGHTSQKSGEILDLGHLVCIDTYCYGGGWLTALDVHTDEVWQTNREGEPRQTSSV